MFRSAPILCSLSDLATVLLFVTAASFAGESSTDIPLVDETQNNLLICLGPIGVRVKTETRLDGSAESLSNSGVVKFIYSGTPAEGRLALEDEIVGVNGQVFNKDFSRKMAAAIDYSEGKDGKMVLNVLRKGKPVEVKFTVPVIGTYGPTYPYNCKKSDWVLESACDWLVRHQNKDGRFDVGGYIVNSAVAGLALLGTGNPKYFPNVQRLSQTLVKFFDKTLQASDNSLYTWQLNYGAIFLAEYYLATSDTSVLPTLKLLNAAIRSHQLDKMAPADRDAFAAKNSEAPPYWFGHGLPTIKDGYACLGVNVANALVAWRLISECGIPTDLVHYEKTRDYVQVAGPSGEMPYGGVPNQRGGDGDAFGRTGVLAVSYYLCNDRKEHAQKIAGTLKRIQKENYFTSHASSNMGKMWGTLGMAALDPVLFRESMDTHKFDYCLVRLCDGSFAANPEAHFQNGGVNNDFPYGRVWNTAFNALIFTLNKRKLRITGKQNSPAGKQPSKTEISSANDKKPAEPTKAAPPVPERVIAKDVLDQWGSRFSSKLQALVASGTKLNLQLDGQPPLEVRAASETELTVRLQGNDLPMPWRQISWNSRARLATDASKNEDLETILSAAVFWAAAKDPKKSEENFARARTKDAATTEAAQKALLK